MSSGRDGMRKASGWTIGAVIVALLATAAGATDAEVEVRVDSIEVKAGGRPAFVRMEADARVTIVIVNGAGGILADGEVRVGSGGEEKKFVLPDLDPQDGHIIEIGVDTEVRPGTYPLRVVV